MDQTIGGKTVVEFPIATGGEIKIEVAHLVKPAGSISALPGKLAVRAGKSFEEAISQLKPVAEAVYNQLSDIAPNECAVEFGIKLSGDLDLVIASGQAEANFKVTMTWKR